MDRNISMPNGEIEEGLIGLLVKRPRWIGYFITILLEALIILGLRLLLPYFPLASYPIPYVILIMAAAYLFGEGPAILAFIIGLTAVAIPILYPAHFKWPPGLNTDDWARLTAFILGTLIVGFAMIIIRKSKERIRQLAIDLQGQRALLDTFMQHIPVGLALHDRDTRHLLANQFIATLSGKSLEEMVGKTVWETLSPDLAKFAAASIQRVFATGKPSIQRDRKIMLDGERYFNVEHHPVRTSQGDIIGVGVMVVETTEAVKTRDILRRSYEREHHIAEILQTSLLGTIPKQIGNFSFETVYRASLDEARVGGDFYDVFQLSDDKIGIVIGDVSGKGLQAATQIAAAKASLRSQAHECDSPAAVLRELNITLIRELNEEAFITIFIGILDAKSETMIYANGGHPPAIFWQDDGQQSILLSHTGPVVGTLKDASYEEQTVALSSGNELLLVTDGLLDLECNSEFLEIEGVTKLYAEMKHSDICSATELVRRVVELCSSGVRDDIAVLRVLVE